MRHTPTQEERSKGHRARREQRDYTPVYSPLARELAEEALRREIAAAKKEAKHATLYRGRIDDI